MCDLKKFDFFGLPAAEKSFLIFWKLYKIMFSLLIPTVMHCASLYHLYNLKKCEKQPWKNVTFSRVAGFSKVTLLHRYFSRFLNSTNGTKSQILKNSIQKIN